jgi:HK97 family phage major capsid protein
MGEWLDNQIANGDGTTEMEGIFTASGTVAVAPALLSGPQTVGDYENLYFGITKPFRTKGQYGNAVCYVANDVTYKRSRQIPVGSDDARRVFGQDYASYRLMDTSYLVQNDIANTKIACVNLAGYRCYKRLGMTVRLEQAGATLALANERLIVVRGRFGGRLVLGGYGAVMTAAQP